METNELIYGDKMFSFPATNDFIFVQSAVVVFTAVHHCKQNPSDLQCKQTLPFRTYKQMLNDKSSEIILE